MNYSDGVQVPLGPLTGRAGDVLTVTSKLGKPFRGEKLIASDSLGGTSTLVRQLFVDGVPSVHLQRRRWWRRLIDWMRRERIDPGIPTICFDVTALGNGLMLPVGEREIAVEIGFLVDCEWRGALLGRSKETP